mgnify:CR=1 FL=1
MSLLHLETGRRVPVEVVTVFGRNDCYYKYSAEDERPDRLRAAEEGLAALNYVKISTDSQVSRTHGLLDPTIPAICDLNSTNGTFVNGQPLVQRYGTTGPMQRLQDRDHLLIGRQEFLVEQANLTGAELSARVRRGRVAVVASDTRGEARAAPLRELLAGRKGFSLEAVYDWQSLGESLARLRGRAQEDGIAVCVVAAGIQGRELLLSGGRFDFLLLLTLFDALPGRKVLVLEVLEGDPSMIVQAFGHLAYEDMVLVAATGESRAAQDDDGLATGAELIRPVAEDESQERGPSLGGRDALERLVAAETNILEVSWTGESPQGIQVVFGARGRGDGTSVSHSLRLGSTTFRF